MSQQHSDKKPITRSQHINQNSLSINQSINNSRNSLLNLSTNKSKSYSNQKQSLPSWSREKEKEKYNTNQNNNTNQRQQKNIFYSQLHIQTNDIDVPLVKILKLNQQLMKKFIYHSNALQLLFKLHNMKSLNYSFRRLSSNLLQVKKYNLNVMKVQAIFDKLAINKLQHAMTKLSAMKNKYKIKQKALIVMKRLIITKINNYYRQFIKNCSQKKLIKLSLQKMDDDEILRLKMNMQIMKQITFSKQFVTKCKPLTKYNTRSLNVFQKQLNKQNLQQSIKLQLQRYQKLRQNVDNKNPNVVESSKSLSKRKIINMNQSLQYENQIVLLVMKSFNLSLIDTKKFYEEKIKQLHADIQYLKSQQRYSQLQHMHRQSQQLNKQYENVINQFYKTDQTIKKTYHQFKQCIQKGRDYNELMNKLINLIQTQNKKYQQLIIKLQNNKNKTQKDNNIIKLYGSKCLFMEISTSILNIKNKQLINLREVYQFMIKNLNTLVVNYTKEQVIVDLIQMIRMNLSQDNEVKQTSIILISVSECILTLHSSYQQQINSMQSQLKVLKKQSKGEYIEQKVSTQAQTIQYQHQFKQKRQQSLNKDIEQIQSPITKEIVTKTDVSTQKQFQRQQNNNKQIQSKYTNEIHTQTEQIQIEGKKQSTQTKIINQQKPLNKQLSTQTLQIYTQPTNKKPQIIQVINIKTQQTYTQTTLIEDKKILKQNKIIVQKNNYNSQTQQQSIDTNERQIQTDLDNRYDDHSIRKQQNTKQQEQTIQIKPNYDLISERLRKCIIQYVQNVNTSYQNNKPITMQNIMINKNLLIQTQGGNKLLQNIMINSIVKQLNTHIMTMVNNLNESVLSNNQQQKQKGQLIKLVQQFHQMILSKTNNNKHTQYDRKWNQLFNKMKQNKNNNNSKKHNNLINKLNEVLIVFKQIQSINNTTTTSPIKYSSTIINNDYTQQLKKILKQKLQFQKQYHQIQSKFLIKNQQYNLMQKQNQQYKQKILLLQKHLANYKYQKLLFNDKQQMYQHNIQTINNQLELYKKYNKKQIQQNNNLNKQIYKLNRQLQQLNRHIELINNQKQSLNVELRNIRVREKQIIVVDRKENKDNEEQQKGKKQDISKQLQQQQRSKQKQQQINKQLQLSIYDYQRINTTLKLHLTHLQKTINQLHSDKNKLTQQIYKLKKQLHQLQIQNKQHKFQLQRKQIQLFNQKIKNKQFVEIEVTYQVQIDKLNDQVKLFKEKVMQLNKIIVESNRERKLIGQTHIGQSNKQEIKSQKDKDKYQQQSIQYRTQLNNLTKQNKQLLLTIQQTQHKLKHNQQQLKQIRKQHSQKVNNIKHQYQQQSNRVKQFYNQQLSQLQNLLKNQSLLHQKTLNIYQHKLQQLAKDKSLGNIINKDDYQRQNISNLQQQQQQKQQLYQHEKPTNISTKQTQQQQQKQQDYHPQTITTTTNTYNNYHILSFDPQQQIRSLKQFINTLQTQNIHLNNKYQKLKKQLYSDQQTSTVHSVKYINNNNNKNQQLHSVSFYQSLVYDLKVENDRLYGQLLKVKYRPLETSRQQYKSNSEQKRQQFWLSQIRKKQLTIQQQQKIINDLKYQLQQEQEKIKYYQIKQHQIQTTTYVKKQTTQQTKHYQSENQLFIDNNMRQQLQQTIQTNQITYKQSQANYQLHIKQLQQQILKLNKQCSQYKQQVIQIKKQYQQDKQTIVDYDRLLIVFKQVKLLYGEYIQATQQVLLRLDNLVEGGERGSKNYKNQREQSQTLNQVIEQFRRVITNNEQTLTILYENIVTNNTVRTSLQLHYLKQLTFNIVSKFYLPYYHNHNIIKTVHNKNNNNSQYTDLVSKELYQQIGRMFNFQKNNNNKDYQSQYNNKNRHLLPTVQQIFINVQQFIINKIELSLDSYKQQLHTKAIQLQHLQKQLNIIINHNLVQQHQLINTIPSFNVNLQKQHSQYNMFKSNYEFFYQQQQQQQQRLFTSHNYSYQLKQPYQTNHNNNYLSHNITNNSPFIKAPHNSIINPSPYSNNYVSKTSSNYQYRPQTTLIDKYDLMERSISQTDNVILYRSQVNHNIQYHHQLSQ